MVHIFAHTLQCDHCRDGCLFTVHTENAWAIIQKAQEAGWDRYGEKDVCPSCQEKRLNGKNHRKHGDD